MVLPFTLQQLRILKAIASEKSFTQAAKSLFISQPTLSKQIKILEDRLGLLLLNREKTTISFTEAGKVFLQYSERILALCEESCRALNDVKNGDRGNLIVGASQTIGTYLMPRMLAVFAKDYPQINLKVQVDSTRIIAKNVVNKEVDIAVVGGNIPEEFKKNLEVEDFIDDELILIVPKSHPFTFRKQKKIYKDDLYDLNFITLHSTSTIQKFIETSLIQKKIETKKFNVTMQLNSIEGIKSAVSLGLGAAFVSSSAIDREKQLNSIDIINIENIKIKRTLSIITNRHCYHSKALEFFHKDLYLFRHIKNNI